MNQKSFRSIFLVEPSLRHQPLEGAAPRLNLFGVLFLSKVWIVWPMRCHISENILCFFSGKEFVNFPPSFVGPEFVVMVDSFVAEEETLVCPQARRHRCQQLQLANFDLFRVVFSFLSPNLVDDVTDICKTYDLFMPDRRLLRHLSLERTFEKDLERRFYITIIQRSAILQVPGKVANTCCKWSH